jgi:DNA-binding NtrC family response regulator
MSAPLRALIVEDKADDAELLVLELRRAQYDVAPRVVTSLDELREALDEPWDVVYADYHLEGFTGADALAVVRRERGLDTPFIVVSGTIGEDVAVAAMRAGADDYFRKEHLERLTAATGRCLRDAESRRRLAEAEQQRIALERKLVTMTKRGAARHRAAGGSRAPLRLPEPGARAPVRPAARLAGPRGRGGRGAHGGRP